MNEQTQTQQEITTQLDGLTETMKREKIKLSPEMSEYLKQNVEGLQGKLMRGEPVYPKDLEFVEEVKKWMVMPEILREKYPNMETFENGGWMIELYLKLSKSYDKMTDTLDNFGYTDEKPDRETVFNTIFNLGPKKLNNINKFKRPTIIITPKGSLASKIEKLDANKKYSNLTGKPDRQSDTYFNKPPNDFIWGPPNSKFIVSIIDGAPEMPLDLPADKTDLTNEEKYKYLNKKYKKSGMKMITAQEYIMFAQMSLRNYETGKNDQDEIIDKNMVTCLNTEHLNQLLWIPFSFWGTSFLGFHFDLQSTNDKNRNINSRPSIKIMEIK